MISSRFYLLFLIILAGCTASYAKAPYPMPERPKNVPLEATWEGKHSPIWARGSRDEGNKTLWYEDGTYLYREILVKKDYKKSIRYHENGRIQKIGQLRYFKDKYYDNDGNLIGWIEFGKWKEYDEDGNLVHEYCYTPNEKGGDVAMICGEEILYNQDSSVEEKQQRKYKCNYGCEELEYKDPVK